MIKYFTTCFIFLIICIASVSAQKKLSITSPNGQIIFSFNINNGHPEYAVEYKNQSLIEHSSLGLSFINNDSFGNNIQMGKAIISDGVDDYTLPEGKTSKVYDVYKEASIPMHEMNDKKDWLYFM
jgi:alpha-glucosidase